VPLTSIALSDQKVLAAYERRLVLVRPDGHVAWRADAEPADAGALIDVVRGQSLHRHSGAARKRAIRNPDAHCAPASGFRVRAPKARAPE
jgi:hypothetical protein